MTQQTFRVEAKSASDLRTQIKHAEALGFELADVTFFGSWDTKRGDPVFISGMSQEPAKIGTKYIQAEIDGRVTKILPADGTAGHGAMMAAFSEVDN